jgi:hypothetical protein
LCLTTSIQFVVIIAPPFPFPFTLDLLMTILTFATRLFLEKTCMSAGSWTCLWMWLVVKFFEKYYIYISQVNALSIPIGCNN